MPNIVANGRTGDPNATACAQCHLVNGKGRPENASVSGLPVSYSAAADGLPQRSAEERGAAQGELGCMALIAKSLTPDEMKAAAEYFGAIKWTPWVRVVETNTVAKMKSNGGIWVPIEGEGAGRRPIGVRIIETPRTWSSPKCSAARAPGVIAYAPVGAIKKGEQLVKTGGNGKTIACGECHGLTCSVWARCQASRDVRRAISVASCMTCRRARATWQWTQLMKPVVAKLTSEDLVNILAYVSSRPVNGAANAKVG